MTHTSEDWVPEACTLPTIERPLRLIEFDGLFARGLTAQQRLSATLLRWSLDRGVESEARDLTARETACCSFFTFGFIVVGAALQVDVQVPPTQAKVLDELAARASAGLAVR